MTALIIIYYYPKAKNNNKKTAENKNTKIISITQTDIRINTKRIETEESNWKEYESIDLGFRLKYSPNTQIYKEENNQHNRIVFFKGDNLHFGVMLKEATNIILDNYHFLDSPIKERFP